MTQQTVSDTYRGTPAELYDRHFVPAIGAPIARELVDRAGLRPGERVLDIACGTGVVARLAAGQVGERGEVAGVDVNPGMLAVARAGEAGETIRWHQASAEALPLPDAAFDVAFCQMGLQFFPDAPAALGEMHRVLAPGGRAAINVPGPTPALFTVLEEALRSHLGPDVSAFVRLVFSLHGPGRLRELLVGAGFADVEASSERRTLELPPPADFLWQYVLGTPLAAAAEHLDEEGRAALEQEVVAGWRPFVADGGVRLDVDITVATGRA